MIHYQAHKISESLYQGGFPPPGDGLQKSGIDVLVLCAKEWQDESNRSYPGVHVIRCGGEDRLEPHILRTYLGGWQHAARLVVRHIRDGKNVLVTCMAGQNRSGIVTAMALRELTMLPGHEIVDHIQRSRPHALNNETFAKFIINNFPE